MPCADDTALWSRVIYVSFDELKGEPPASNLYGDFISAIKLHSALMPEYFTLARSPDGFDLCAINDFTAFLDEVTCKSRERNNSGWARVGYMMVLLTKVYQGSYEKMHELLEFVAKSCHYQATRMLGAPGIFDKFLTIVLETIARGQSIHFDSDQCAYFHCYRTTITIGDEPVLALRLDWWVKYLKTKKLLDVTAAQLRDARPKEHSDMRTDVPFYDVQTSPWCNSFRTPRIKRSMPPATAQNRPLYINFNPNNPGRLFEYRPALVNGVLQWVLQPVYHLRALIQRLIRRIRAATWYNQGFRGGSGF